MFVRETSVAGMFLVLCLYESLGLYREIVWLVEVVSEDYRYRCRLPALGRLVSWLVTA